MIKNKKILIGGLYLVDLSGHVNPEFGFYHYCVILKTNDKDLFLAFSTTSKKKIDEHTFFIPEDNSLCLFKHTRSISKMRIMKPLIKNNKPIVLSNENLIKMIDEYKNFIEDITNRSIYSNRIILLNIKEKEILKINS